MSGAIIVVEGYIDAIAVSEAGFPNVVAPLGTALTPDQCALLWAMASEPILCFDGDGAGRRAAFRAIETALPLIGAGKSLRFALLPEGQDPDDLIRLERAGGDGRASRRRARRSPTCCSCAKPTASVSTRPSSARRSSDDLSRRSEKSPTRRCAGTTRRT